MLVATFSHQGELIVKSVSGEISYNLSFFIHRKNNEEEKERLEIG